MQHNYRNHIQGLHSHRIAVASTSMKQYTMGIQDGGMEQNNFLPSKRNSVAGCNSTSLGTTHPVPGMKSGPFQHESHHINAD